MEKKYESLTLLEFQRQFPDDKSCYDYLAEMKWPGGFNASDPLTPTAVKANSIELANVLNVVIRLPPPATPFSIK